MGCEREYCNSNDSRQNVSSSQKEMLTLHLHSCVADKDADGAPWPVLVASFEGRGGSPGFVGAGRRLVVHLHFDVLPAYRCACHDRSQRVVHGSDPFLVRMIHVRPTLINCVHERPRRDSVRLLGVNLISSGASRRKTWEECRSARSKLESAPNSLSTRTACAPLMVQTSCPQ